MGIEKGGKAQGTAFTREKQELPRNRKRYRNGETKIWFLRHEKQYLKNMSQKTKEGKLGN